MLTVRLREEAEQDLVDAASCYESQHPGLGHDFLDEVLSTFMSISEQPSLYPTVHRNTPRVLMPRFPFGIYYRIERAYVAIVAVMHGSRHPRRWQDRT